MMTLPRKPRALMALPQGANQRRSLNFSVEVGRRTHTKSHPILG